jgi:predicted HTH transcriptional regulator
LNKSITQPQLAKVLNISDTAVYRTLEKLKADNKIVRVGSRRKGYWEVVSE